MDAVRVSFDDRPGEYARALRRVQAHRLHVRRDLALGAAGSAGATALWMAGGPTLWAASLASAAIALLLILVTALFVVPALVERSDPKLRHPYELRYSNDGIRFVTTGIESHLAWSVYTAWREDTEYVYLLRGSRDVSVIPTRAFASASDRASFVEMVTRQLGVAGAVAQRVGSPERARRRRERDSSTAAHGRGPRSVVPRCPGSVLALSGHDAVETGGIASRRVDEEYRWQNN